MTDYFMFSSNQTRLYKLIMIVAMVLLLVACSSENLASITPPIAPGYTSTGVPAGLMIKTPEPAASALLIPTSLALTPEKPTQTPAVVTLLKLTPTSDYSDIVDIWTDYSNEDYGFSFEYPGLYDTETYSQCSVTVLSDQNFLLLLGFGYRSELGVIENDRPSFDQFVDQWIKAKALDVTYREDQTIRDMKISTIEYRFGGLNRYGMSTFYGRDNLIYIFNFTAGSSYCDLREIGINEFTVYKHAVDTFDLLSQSP